MAADDVEVLRGADVVVMTAGAKQKPGQTRMDLAEANTQICAKILPEVVRVAPDALLLMVTNPVDVVTEVALKLTGLPWQRVVGSGTVLDSSRFRYLVAKHCDVAVQNVHAYIAGEHGDSEIPLWASATIGSIPLSQWSVEGHGRLTSARQGRDRKEREGSGVPGDPGQGRDELRRGVGGVQYSRSDFV